MNADDIRDFRAEAEKKILGILSELQSLTGLCAIDIRVDTFEETKMEDRYRRTHLSAVSIKLESL